MGILNILKKPLRIFQKLSFKKKIVVVVLIVVIFFVWNKVSVGKESKYAMGEVSRATLQQAVSEIGNVEGGTSAKIVSPATGIIEEIFVDNGDKVAVDDLLFKVQSTATEQEQSAAYSNYLTALSAFNGANSTANSLKSTMLSKWKTYYDLATNSTYEDDDDNPKTEARNSVEFHTAQNDWLSAEAKYGAGNKIPSSIIQARAS